MAIADNSEVEGLSDGEENDLAVDEYIPHDFDFMPVEQQPERVVEPSDLEDGSDEDSVLRMMLSQNSCFYSVALYVVSKC